MLERAIAEWKRFRSSKPGKRFRERFRRKHSVGEERRWRRPLYIGAGSVVFTLGVLLKAIPFLPGGSAVMTFGASLVSRESKTAAETLDKFELRVRGWFKSWKKRDR